MVRVILWMLLAAPLAGCSTLAFWRDDKEPEKDKGKEPVQDADEAKADAEPEEEDDGGLFSFGESKKAVVKAAKKPAAADEHELKLAKLWARVDELEEEQLRQKERVRVLEKGLTLGLVPEELKPKREAPPPAPPAQEPPKAPEAAAAKAPESPPAVSPEEESRYQAALASAHDHFRAGRYGRAIVEYSDIVKSFGDRIDRGMSKYWVAKCWINLKEYNTARQHLGDFLKESPESPWVPRAKLELARVEWKLGLSETALQRFRDVIQQHPYEDAAEMAKMELQNLDKTL